MERTWGDFKSLHSNNEGARKAFEDCCETLFRQVYGQEHHVNQIAVHQGDGGIDIFVGEIGVEPITVIQCKFFIDDFGESQKSQIRKSFKSSITSADYVVKQWILCMPRQLNLEQSKWWAGWKAKQIKENNKEQHFIRLTTGNEIIDLLKKHELYHQVFKIEDSLKLDALFKKFIIDGSKLPETIPVEAILFNNYTSKTEPFYLQRSLDVQFMNSLQLGNIWIHGNSGIGKTAMLHRNLIHKKVKFIYCDMSPTSITKSDDFFEEVLCNIEEHLEQARRNNNNRLKEISHLLANSTKKDMIIVIDELSIPNREVVKEIAEDLVKLVTHYRNSRSSTYLKFAISTIWDPKLVIQNKSKAADHFIYLDCGNWDEDIHLLFEILTKNLHLDLSAFQIPILTSCKNSPRTLKTILRKIIALNDQSQSLSNVIDQTLNEIVE